METYEAERIITQELGSQERLLWSGRPQQGLMFRPTDLFQIPFSLLWCGFAIFWESSVLTTKAPFFFRLWGVPFVLIGLYMVAGRFIFDAAERGKMVYALTTERVLIIRTFFRRSVKSISLRTLVDTALSVRPDGSGTITLGAGSAWSSRRQPAPPALEGIRDARVVHEQLLLAQKST